MKKVVEILKRCSHNAFPVVDSNPVLDIDMPTYGRLRGLIRRGEILSMIKQGFFCNAEDHGRERVEEDYDLLHADYPRYPTLDDVKLSDEEQENLQLDFSLVMDLSPHTVFASKTYTETFSLVRKLGLRHLVVINFKNEVVGMITRSNLVQLGIEIDSYGEAYLKTKPIVYNLKPRHEEPNFFERSWQRLRRRRYENLNDENNS